MLELRAEKLRAEAEVARGVGATALELNYTSGLPLPEAEGCCSQ